MDELAGGRYFQFVSADGRENHELINMKCRRCQKRMTIDRMQNGKRSIIYHWVCTCGYKTITIEEKG